ncbi:hypothetical protein H4W23_00860 [Streptomyces gardneri]|uniref:hypothetical protein n=1 Tax=Streptomyces gardneri TaxID=66892 RepID=UPI0006BDE97E|nr:hypothetical protein [Streptomyces gardneri]QPK43331.1 hypothetical protein H4W23_00860 [Streptomyces gardneri]WRK34554.1 hypothetical protein U0M97_00855 [Streptomyces venezuelae]CUM44018.1 hypothetical protein BN2537_17001 [Streptomyces venezuelae]
MQAIAAPADVVAKLCWCLGVVRCLRGEYEAATVLGERTRTEALRAHSAAAGERWTWSYTEYQLAVIALHEERPDDAAAHARSMLRDKQAIGDTFVSGWASTSLQPLWRH